MPSGQLWYKTVVGGAAAYFEDCFKKTEKKLRPVMWSTGACESPYKEGCGQGGQGV